MNSNSKTATCLICLKNNDTEKELMLFNLFTQEWGNLVYLNKLQAVLNAEITIYEETLICRACLDDLNKAYEFREKVITALDYWSIKFEESVSLENKCNEQDIIDVNENNEIGESNIVTEDIVSVNKDNTGNRNESTESMVEECMKELDSDSSFSCSKCKVTFSADSELINHSCKDQTSDQTMCASEKKPKKRRKQKSGTYNNFCDLHFSKVWKRNKHFEIDAGDKKFVCSFCNHAFKQSYHLREHLTIHTGERNFNCGVCGKKFQRMSSQKRHMRTHSAPPGEKSKKTPFLCNICGKSFPYSNGAQRHMRIHTGDKRYECDVCGKKFNQSTHLKVHLRTHTGERPYMCNICGDAFSLKASLHKHMNSHSDTKNDVKIFQNLEPNLSQTHNEDMPMYDEGFLITCSQ